MVLVFCMKEAWAANIDKAIYYYQTAAKMGYNASIDALKRLRK